VVRPFGAAPHDVLNVRRKIRTIAATVTMLALPLAVLPVKAAAKRTIAQKKQAAKTQYERAEQLREELHGTPKDERSADEYQQVIDAFRKVYYTAPTSSKADESVLAVAELLAEMGRVFDDDKYSQSAIGQYEYLRREYPGSRFRIEALFAIGQIDHEQLGDDAKARATFDDFLKKYPSHRLAEQARATIKEIEEQEKATLAAKTVKKDKKDVHTNAKQNGKELPAQKPMAKNDVAKNEAAEPSVDSTAATDNAKLDVPVQAHNSKLPLLTGIRHWSTGDYTRVAIDLDDEVKFDSGRIPSPDRIYFDLSNTKLAAELVGKTFDVGEGFLRKVRVAQYTLHDVRVVFDVDNAAEYAAFLLPNPYRLIIDIHGKKNDSAPTKSKPVIEAKPAQDQKMNASTAKPASTVTQNSKPTLVATVELPPVVGPEPPAPEPSSKIKAVSDPAKIPEKTDTGSSATETALSTSENKISVKAAPASDKDSANTTAAVNNTKGSKRSTKTAKGSESSSDIAANNYRAAQPTANGDRSLIRALGLKIGRIVIDAGHGGHDTGTVGPNGLMEKDLVLDVALRLGKMLEEQMGAEVVYTREDDTFIPLETRTAIANQKQADLFLSIHANSSRDASARGVETYYLNFTQDAHALEVAARENSVSEKSIFELQDLVKKIALKEKIEESREFAADVQKSLHSVLATRQAAIKDRGVKKAPFIVLIGANMPSVLAEISFVSNPTDEKKLRTGDYRQKIADSLFQGISQYAGGLSGVKVASKMPSTTGE